MAVTFEVSQEPMFWLKAAAPWNMVLVLVTLPKFQFQLGTGSGHHGTAIKQVGQAGDVGQIGRVGGSDLQVAGRLKGAPSSR